MKKVQIFAPLLLWLGLALSGLAAAQTQTQPPPQTQATLHVYGQNRMPT